MTSLRNTRVRATGIASVMLAVGVLVLLSAMGVLAQNEAPGYAFPGPAVAAPEPPGLTGLQVYEFAGSAPLLAHGLAAESGFRDGAPSEALFAGPLDIAVGSSGTLVLADSGNRAIRRIGRDGQTSTIVAPSSDDGPNAILSMPVGVAAGAFDNTFVVDAETYLVYEVRSAGEFNEVAGVNYLACNPTPEKHGPEGEITPTPTPEACPGDDEVMYRDGSAAKALFDEPTSLAVAADGNVLISDWDNHCIRRLSPDGDVSTFAGRCGMAGLRDGDRQSALFTGPGDIAIANDGSVYVVDQGSMIRRIGRDGRVSTLAGSGDVGYVDGAAGEARFFGIAGIALDSIGNVYLTETQNQTVRMFTVETGEVRTLAGGAGQGLRLGPASEAQFSYPAGIALSDRGEIYVADYNLNRILVLR